MEEYSFMAFNEDDFLDWVKTLTHLIEARKNWNDYMVKCMEKNSDERTEEEKQRAKDMAQNCTAFGEGI